MLGHLMLRVVVGRGRRASGNAIGLRFCTEHARAGTRVRLPADARRARSVDEALLRRRRHLSAMSMSARFPRYSVLFGNFAPLSLGDNCDLGHAVNWIK